MATPDDNARLSRLMSDLEAVRRRCASAAAVVEPEGQRFPPVCMPAARNLLHYVGLREHYPGDLREELAAVGLSPLYQVEGRVLETLDAILGLLSRLTGPPGGHGRRPLGAAQDGDPARHNAEWLLGPPPAGRGQHIMVTMPAEAAGRYGLVRDLLAAGMSIMRINCAHDDPPAWAAMIDHLRRAERTLGVNCRVFIDLAGNKIRTGATRNGGRVVRWKPQRNYRGQVVTPARVWFGQGPGRVARSRGASAVVQVGGELVREARVDDVLRLRDARGRRREVRVVSCHGDGFWGECERTAYVESGATVRLFRDERELLKTQVGDLPWREDPLRVFTGDRLTLTERGVSGPPTRGAVGAPRARHVQITCSRPEIYRDVRVGERVVFDDGKVEGLVRAVGKGRLEVEVTHALPDGSKLGSHKGVNFPDSRLSVPPLTATDLDDLEFAATRADVIGFSFVRDPSDVKALYDRLADLGVAAPRVALKVETRAAFEQLPAILLEGLRYQPVAVMVARGDLAVELGFERLAESQQEILRYSEAAHAPVIVATQILETLAKTGTVSRPELLDVAASRGGHCLMLNKGPHIVEAVRFLDRLLRHSGSSPSVAHDATSRPERRPTDPNGQPRSVACSAGG
jgi:pyruvate kinase